MGRELEPVRQNRVVLYTTDDGKVTVDVFFAHDNFWLTQRTMAELFGVKTPAVSRHLKNIYASGELTPEATISKMETVQMEGKRQESCLTKMTLKIVVSVLPLLVLLYLESLQAKPHLQRLCVIVLHGVVFD